MATYTAEQLSGAGTPIEALTGGQNNYQEQEHQSKH